MNRRMNRRTLIACMAAMPILATLARRPVVAAAFELPEFTPLKKSKEAWKALLPVDRYRVLFEEDTERPFSSPLDKEKRDGLFICAACYLPLFLSEYKYDSGTGWPSFTRPIEGAMGKKTDFRLILPRTEYHCVRCTGHQGHVFKDGPPPRNERWCNNGLALLFVPEGEPLPALRS